MPIYSVEHSYPLNLSQRDRLAQAITTIHSETFTTPRLFVQVYFTDISERKMYIGGKFSVGNHIRGQVRSGPSRSQDDWNDLCKKIAAAWEEIVGVPGQKGKGREVELRSVILIGGMIAGLEVGVLLPPAGGDVEWLRGNMGHFEMLAGKGDEEMKDLVAEVRERGLLEGSDKTMAQRLEEMLGWGDSA